jgi:hypothetical protein
MQRRGYPAVFVLVVVAAAAAACLSAPGLAAWTDGLPDSALTRLAGTAAHRLADGCARIGLDRPMVAVQAATRRAEATHFGDQ